MSTIAGGPGSQLKAIFSLLGVGAQKCNKCNELARWMDAIGPEECVKQLSTIVTRINENKKLANINWQKRIAIGLTAIREGLPLTLEGLVLEAICRAESNQPPPSPP